MISIYKQLEFLLQFGTLTKSKSYYQFTPHLKHLELFGFSDCELSAIDKQEDVPPFNYVSLEKLIIVCFDAAIKNHQRQQQPI
jgi:hypothetical protein